MFYNLLLLLLLLRSSESLQKYTIKNGGPWSASEHSCDDAGVKEEATEFNLPNLQELGLKYENIEELTTVIIRFENTRVSSKYVQQPVDLLLLDTHTTSKTFKAFSGCHKLKATRLWASQENVIDVTIRFYETGTVKMNLRAVAESRSSWSCAYTFANVTAIDVIVNSFSC
ncbi:hypothetical protein NE865_02986 [Phthorimaea operculella]|nr:hypothetical protein NE865_02986 [Phthorimaea operculella]